MNYKPIDIEYVVRLINDILGEDFYVESNGVSLLSSDKITNCSLQAVREPFPMDNINSETLQLTLYAYMNVDNRRIKSLNESKLSKILGARKGSFQSLDGSETYSFNLYFKDCHPAAEPQPDMGNMCCLYAANGSMLITLEGKGGILSNDISYELADRPFTDTECISSELAVLNVEETPNLQNEAMVNLESLNVITTAQAKACTIGINGIMLNDVLHDKLSEAIEANSNTTEFYLRKKSNKGTGIRHMRLVEGKLSVIPGSYMQYTISLQEV